MKEIIIIGGGIIGCCIAHELGAYDCHVTLIEKHADIAEEISAANSAIVHAGYDPEDGTLKARLNVRGKMLYPKLCTSLHVDYQQCGAYVLACGEEEESQLSVLYERALRRNIQVHLLTRDALLKEEPHISTQVTKAMAVPETAIITPWEVCEALVEESMLNGVRLVLNEEVHSLRSLSQRFIVTTNKAEYQGDLVINATGIQAQKVMEMIEEVSLFTQTLKRGQYFVLSKQANTLVHSVIYPVPTKHGKGVLCVPTCHGNMLLGPNSEQLIKEDTSTTTEGLERVTRKLAKTVTDVSFAQVIHSFSGLRPTGNHNDFFIQESIAYRGLYHCACIDSPGLASAPAIGEYVVQELILPKHAMKKKKQYQKRTPLIRMKDLDDETKQIMINKEPGYGHIICRCEEISEQEVVNCIHHECGAHSIKGVKKRVRPGMGKCQGGFCEVEIAKILARELHIPLEHVAYDQTSYYAINKGGK